MGDSDLRKVLQGILERNFQNKLTQCNFSNMRIKCYFCAKCLQFSFNLFSCLQLCQFSLCFMQIGGKARCYLFFNFLFIVEKAFLFVIGSMHTSPFTNPFKNKNPSLFLFLSILYFYLVENKFANSSIDPVFSNPYFTNCFSQEECKFSLQMKSKWKEKIYLCVICFQIFKLHLIFLEINFVL